MTKHDNDEDYIYDDEDDDPVSPVFYFFCAIAVIALMWLLTAQFSGPAPITPGGAPLHPEEFHHDLYGDD